MSKPLPGGSGSAPNFFAPLSLKETIIQDVKRLGLDKALLQYFENLPNKAFASVSLLNAHKHFQKQQQLKNSIQADEFETIPLILKDFYLTEQLAAWIEKPD